jgi:hypothetical protein
MSSVYVTTIANTVTVSDDGAVVTVRSGEISQVTFDALETRVTEIEASFDAGAY